MRLALGTVIGLFIFSFAAFCQQPAVRRITIELSGSGLGPSANQKLFIQSRGDKNYLGDELVDSNRIESLLAALSSPTLATPQSGNLGITREWLSQNVREAPSNGAPNQLALFKESFSDLNTVDQLLPSCFKFWKSDDYPSIRVTVVFANGKRWTASSDSYYPFMLPWRVNLNGTEQTTYNAGISRGIAALVPSGTLNRNRLGDEELKTRLAEAVMASIKDKWDFLGVENQAQDSFEILRRNFEVEHSRISPYRSVDYGWVGNELGPHEKKSFGNPAKTISPAPYRGRRCSPFS